MSMSSAVMKSLNSLYCSGVEEGIKFIIKKYNMEVRECEIEKYVMEICVDVIDCEDGQSNGKAKKPSKAKEASKAKVAKEAKEASKAKVAVEAEEAVEAKVAKVAKVAKEVPEKKVVIGIPIPFNKKQINDDGCHGLAYNHGLFTQCEKKRLETGSYCKTCQKESDINVQPANGTIEERCAMESMEYTDIKGRKPVSYLKVLEKQNISVEQAKSIASEFNIEIEAFHFESQEQKRGRPKTKASKQVEAATVEDLFAALMKEEDELEIGSQDDTIIMTDSEEECEKKNKKSKKNNEEKKMEQAAEKDERTNMKQEESEQRKYEAAAEKEAKLQKALAEKSEKEAKLQAEKEAKEAKLQQAAAEKEAKLQKALAEKSEKEAKLQQAAAEKEAKLQQAAAEKEAKLQQAAAEKEAKLQQAAAEKEAKLQKALAEKSEKEAKLQQAAAEKESKVKGKKSEPIVAAKEVEEEAVKVSVKRITIDGKEYFRTSDNILYDPVTKDEVGLYDEKSNSIKELPEESDDELKEDEYDSN